MPDDEETQHEWASGTSTPYPRRGSREQLPELGSRAIKAGFNRLLADPQNHRSVGLAHFVDAAKEQYLAQTLRQLVDRPTNPGEFSPIGRHRVRRGSIARYVMRTLERKRTGRSEEHTSELQSLMRISYAVFCLKKKNKHN